MGLDWDNDSVADLAQLANAFRKYSRCAAFADYCDLRAQGRRKPALNSLKTFLEAFETWTGKDRRAWANELMELQLAHANVHQLIAHPLKRTLITLFEEWAEAEPANPAPCRGLGVLTRTPEWFREALARDAGDEYSRWRVAQDLIAEAEFGGHHIPEDFIGEPADADRLLDEAEALLAPIANTKRGRFAMEALTSERQKIADWIGFQASGSDNFDDWCRQERGYTWEHSIVVYHNK